MVIVENPRFDGTALMDFIATADSREKARIRTDVPSATEALNRMKVVARKTLDLSFQMTAGAVTDKYCRYNMTIRKPNVLDKLRNGENIATEEQAFSDVLKLEDNLSIGVPYYESLLNIDPSKRFEEIIPVERKLAAMAAGDIAVIGGAQVNIPPGWLGVLLGVMVDITAFAGVGVGDTFLIVDRDDDPTMMKLEIKGCADGLYMPCYLPFLNSTKVYLESATGSGGNIIQAGFFYGLRKMTDSDYVRWGLSFPTPLQASEASRILSQYPKTLAGLKSGVS
jgi:hypothetical protein